LPFQEFFFLSKEFLLPSKEFLFLSKEFLLPFQEFLLPFQEFLLPAKEVVRQAKRIFSRSIQEAMAMAKTIFHYILAFCRGEPQGIKPYGLRLITRKPTSATGR
jgi:hypothetical protein